MILIVAPKSTYIEQISEECEDAGAEFKVVGTVDDRTSVQVEFLSVSDAHFGRNAAIDVVVVAAVDRVQLHQVLTENINFSSSRELI